jgi:hypothetical protein
MITLVELPKFLDRWQVRHELVDGWETRGRGSGGFDAFMGVVVHHTASPPGTPLANTIHYALTGPDHPIANGVVSRDRDGPKFVLWAALAANHAGTGGPVLTSRGVVAKDSANRVMFGMEAENSGVGEPWADDMLDLYVRAVAAICDWATTCTPGPPVGAGDVIAHREWTPGRKIDPAGPSRFANAAGVWDMDRFRGEVFAAQLNPPTKEDDDMKPIFIGVENSPGQYLWSPGTKPIPFVDPPQRDLLLKAFGIDIDSGVTLSQAMFDRLT